jgi:hypothetical protein
MAGARLAAISVFSGALATAISLIGVAYVATVGSSVNAARDSSLSRARDTVSVRQGKIVSQPPGDDTSTFGDVHVTGVARPHRIGTLTVVDVPPDVGSLDEELGRQIALARTQGQRVLLWIFVPDCKPCDAVESALSSPELQSALAHSRLVRVSAADFIAELSRIGVPVDAFPGFAVLGSDGHATDYLNGGEWDEDTPENIAPVLKSFADGTPERRRNPWRGGPHEDETPI